ncbi:hypothetical protein [Gemmata sp.]|uniref:hypothetical protein n=1 Tax=Gemmata sp. TaxID=1914242 RepID=UPI003F718DFF
MKTAKKTAKKTATPKADRTSGTAKPRQRSEELRREMVRLYHLAEHIDEAYPGRGAGDSLYDCFVAAACAYARVAVRVEKPEPL